MMRNYVCACTMLFLFPSVVILATVGSIIMARYNIETKGFMVVQSNCVVGDECIIKYKYVAQHDENIYYTDSLVCYNYCKNSTSVPLYYNNFKPEKYSLTEFTGPLEGSIAMIAIAMIFFTIIVIVTIAYFTQEPSTRRSQTNATRLPVPQLKPQLDIVSITVDDKNHVVLAIPENGDGKPVVCMFS